jgi:hypothetical protein
VCDALGAGGVRCQGIGLQGLQGLDSGCGGRRIGFGEVEVGGE